MLRATIKGLLARKLRLLLSGTAVVLAVMFVSGALILNETVGRAFDAQFAGAYDDIDLQVSGVSPLAGVVGGPATAPVPVDAATVARVAGVAGVTRAYGVVQVDGARVVGSDGKVVRSTGGPRLGANWTGETTLRRMQAGRGPQAAGEVVINAGLARAGGFAVGDRIDVLTLAPRRGFTVVGVFEFAGGRESVGGEQVVAFTDPVAQSLMMGRAGVFSAVAVQTGAPREGVRDALRADLGATYQVRTGDELDREAASGSRQLLDLVTNVLLGFAAVAVLVGAFLIINTFAIIVAQRTRELALMRALGASRRQVIATVVVESVVVGLIASALGFGIGVGIAALGVTALTSGDYGLAAAPLRVPGSAVAVCFVVGVGVTVVAALIPAVRASRVPPIAVIRAAATPDRPLTRQTVAGAAVLAVGAALLGLGLSGAAGDGALSAVLGGVLFALIGAALLMPVLSRPLVSALGAVFTRSLPGRLGSRNSARNPRRTAITAAALMIGIALVTSISTVLSSTLDSIGGEIDGRLRADLVVMGDPASTARPTIDPATLAAVRRVGGVKTVAATSFEIAGVRGENLPVGAWDDLSVARAALGLQAAGGTLDDPAPGTMVVSESVAKQLTVSVGDELPVQLQRGAGRTYRVAGIFTNSSLTSGLLIPWADAVQGFGNAQPMQAFVTLADGSDTSAVLAGVEAALRDNPEVTVQTKEEVAGTLGKSFDLVLVAVQLLLAVALLIAVLGIVNTLVLSVLERTRELGLLRAVGLRRAQTVRMIMVESVVISLFGAVLGLTVGAGLGAALVRALRDQGVTGLSMPWGTMLGYLVGAAVVGVLASLLPALRAVRLNVLESIAYE